jgi:hypothetical protein
MRTSWLVALVSVVTELAVRRAEAYPHFQLVSGSSRCSQCHISPAGSSLLSAWGREESSDAISGGGDGRFLHGVFELPESLTLGGDLRAAALANDVGASDGTELVAFPMQADLAGAYTSGPLTILAVIGARGRVRSGAPSSEATSGTIDPNAPNPGAMVESPSLSSYVISREHYIMYRPDQAAGIYARAGRFSAPFGLRLADHTAYVRRYLGYNLLEETFGLGVGYLANSVEVHATGFVYDPLQGGPRKEAGAALLVEHDGDAYIAGVSARASVASSSTRLVAGAHGKVWLAEKLLVQAEVDGVRELFDGVGDRWQLAAYAGPVLVPSRGVYVGAAYQAFAEDLAVRSVLRQGVDAWLSWLPIAHFEIMASARAQRIGPHEHAYNAMLQLHYYL